jgi:hypothetical protein
LKNQSKEQGYGLSILPSAAPARRPKRVAGSLRSCKGEVGLIQCLAGGIWDDSELLVVPPGRRIAAPYDGGISAIEAPVP